MTKMMESALKRTQRKMLRMVVGHGRRLIQTSIVEPDSLGEDVQSNALTQFNQKTSHWKIHETIWNHGWSG